MNARSRTRLSRRADGRRSSWAAAWLVVAAVILALAPLPGLGHGGALELRVAPAELAAGDEMTVTGEGFTANGAIELHLTGPRGDSHFGTVTANDEGEFSQVAQIPGEVLPGIYLIRAVGAGLEASAEVTVGAMAGMSPASANAVAERERSLAWRIVAVALFLGLGAVGFWLTRLAGRGPVRAPLG